MSGRAAPFRSKPSQEFQQLQAQLNTPNNSLYMLQRLGPASFVVGQSSSDEERADAKHKVTLGNVPTCSCSYGPTANREPCIHLLFVLMRVLRIPANNALLWQSALTDRELQQILDGTLARFTASSNTSSRSIQHQADGSSAGSSSSSVQRRPVEQDEPCPICYEPLSVVSQDWQVWCQNGCGRSIHGKCMRVWSDHQTKTLHQDITCPLCRCLWGVFEWRPPPTAAAISGSKAASGKALHRGVKCAACQQSPIEGARHRCLTCAHYNLCSSCFSSGQHLQHSFACQPTPTAPDQIAERPGSAAMAGMFQIGGLLQCSGDRGGACRSTAAGGIGSGIGSVTPLSSGRSSADCDGNGGSSHPTDGAAAAPVTAVLQVQFASRRASCSSNTDSRRPRDSGGGTPDISSDVDGGIRRGRCQQHMQQQCRRQQTASRPLEQLQQQDFFVGTGRAALSTLQQQQQQHHGSPAQHLCRFPIPKRSCPSPTAAGAAAIVREVQSLAISGSGAAAHLLSSQLEHHPSTSCGQESSGKQERQQPLKAPACRISGLVGGVAPALGQQQQQQQPLTLQLIGTAPITDVHTSAYDTTARSSAIASGPAATPNSLSASNIGRIRDRTTRRTTAQAVAATGQEEKPLGTKTFNRDSGVNSGSSSTAVRSSRGLRLQQGSKCPSGGLLTATGDQLNLSMTGTAYQQGC